MQDIDGHHEEASRLEAAARAEADPAARARRLFDVAQHRRAAGDRDKALEIFLELATFDDDPEARFAALHAAAQLLEALDRPFDEVIAAYERAAAAAPSRAEALHGASRFCRLRDRFAEGYAFAKRGLAIPKPAAGRFIEAWIYDYGLLDELAVHAYWSGRYQDCFVACRRLLHDGKMPREMRARVRHNRDSALHWLRQAEAAAERPAAAYPVSAWVPERAQGGTEIMVEALRARLGDALDAVDLHVNGFPPERLTGKPLMVWFHHDTDQGAVQWCRDKALTERVELFVFVSYWQRDRYVEAFGLPPGRCVVLRNATETGAALRPWRPGTTRRIAYTSTPFRGLDILLDAWDRLRPDDAELHIWSSWRLYRLDDDPEARRLFDRARSLANVHYRGIVPNDVLREELRQVDYLAYPSRFAETSCLSVIEAMAAGCRVICSSLGALPETTAGFARLYPWRRDADAHAEAFAALLDDELARPWAGRLELAEAQQTYCRLIYDWSVRVEEWRTLLGQVVHGSAAVGP